MRAPGRVAGVALLALVAGCVAEVPDDPVPTTAEVPVLCDGVPLRGLELMTGTEELAYDGDAVHPWDDDFLCSAAAPDGPSVSVSHQNTAGLGVGSVDEQIDELRAHEGAVSIDSEAAGAGYVIADGSQPYARWICQDGTRTEVRLSATPAGRHVTEDLSRYLTSILPWACRDADVPTRTAG